MEKFKRIVLSVPHAKVEMPIANGWEKCDNEKLEEYVEEMADKDVDKIFRPLIDNVTLITYPYSRFYCDAERLENDEMEEKGQGIVYTHYKDIKREVSVGLNQEVRHSRCEYLRSIIKELVKGKDILLIDCHSFSPTEESKDIDICIGFNEDWSKPDDETLKLIEDTFSELGYRIAYNKPFSNSLTPIVTNTYKSVMIEVNKTIYMHKDLKTLQSDFYKVNNKINIIYKRLLNESKDNG